MKETEGPDLIPVIFCVSIVLLMLLLTELRNYGFTRFAYCWQELKKFVLEIIIVARLRRMTPNETVMLKEFIIEQKSFNRTILEEVHTIKRGVYGDSHNGVKGLLQRQEQDEIERADMKKEISEIKTSLTNIRARAIWTGAGFLAGLQAIWEFVKWKSKGE